MKPTTTEPLFSGSGPGPQTADGCSVELYRDLPYRGELQALSPWLGAGTRVLELGCGTGRLTRPLLAQGCSVVAVDNSAEMLTHLPLRTQAMHAGIETLALAERFDVVLLAAGLIHMPAAETRHAFAACAARHLRPGGLWLVQVHDADWLARVTPGRVTGDEGDDKDLVLWVDQVERSQGQVAMTLRYARADGRQWTHRFRIQPLDEPALRQLAREAGFQDIDWVDASRRWLRCEMP